MRNSCYGFLSDPDEIEVKVGEATRVHRDSIPAVIINDPNLDYKFALPPDKAKRRADLIAKTAQSRGCIRLAEDIRKIANIVSNE